MPNDETITIKKDKLYNALLAFRSIDVSELRDEVRVYLETAAGPLDGNIQVKEIRFIQALLKRLESE